MAALLLAWAALGVLGPSDGPTESPAQVVESEGEHLAPACAETLQGCSTYADCGRPDGPVFAAGRLTDRR